MKTAENYLEQNEFIKNKQGVYLYFDQEKRVHGISLPDILEEYEEYASSLKDERIRELEEENRRLTQWKKEQIEVWSPVLDWFQDNKSIPPGTSISKEALRRSQEFERLEEENKRLREKCNQWDALQDKMDSFYEDGSDADLVDIGEAAAEAFGYL